MNLLKDEQQRNLIFIIISAICVVLSFFNIQIANIDLAWVAIILCGLPIIIEAITELIRAYDIKADLLVSIAIISSIIIGEIFAAGEIALIMAIGGFLEEYTVGKTETRIDELISKTPTTATLVKNNKETTIKAKDIQVGDILKVVPGEIIPSDGVIIEGETSIDQSILTGESLPVDKKVNDEVYSGTINKYGSFLMKANSNNTIEKLTNLVKSANPENAKIVRAADKWATWIVVIALTAAIITYLITGEIIRSVTILVVFCPCALVLATPTAIMAAIGNLSKHGILVKEGEAIEELAKVNNIIFDKTGTLTYGTPEVLDVLPYTETQSKKELIQLISSVENKSEHPLAKAIVKYNKYDLLEVSNFEMNIGRGVKGNIGEDTIIGGNKEYLKEEDITINKDFEEKINEYLSIGATPIYVVKNREILGGIILSDKLRENSDQLISKLKGLNVTPTLLTGDNKNTGKYIAEEVGINNLRYNCLPEDKTEYIKELQLEDNKVAMIGDGINDAPSLKKANVGISMGNIGSDISIEASDISLINDNISDLPFLVKLSRKTFKTININIAFSLALNFAAMILAILGILDPIVGALVHNVGSVIVIIYSALLLNYKDSKSINLGETKSLYKQSNKV